MSPFSNIASEEDNFVDNWEINKSIMEKEIKKMPKVELHVHIEGATKNLKNLIHLR